MEYWDNGVLGKIPVLWHFKRHYAIEFTPVYVNFSL
jgi:hypothetical protein